jgi:hypothetical protein
MLAFAYLFHLELGIGTEWRRPARSDKRADPKLEAPVHHRVPVECEFVPFGLGLLEETQRAIRNARKAMGKTFGSADLINHPTPGRNCGEIEKGYSRIAA